MARPTEVPVDEKRIDKLTASYRSAYRQILATIIDNPLATISQRAEVLLQVRGILSGLGQDTDAFIKEYFPKQYERGFNDSTVELKALSSLKVRGFGQIHQLAVAAMVDEAQRAFLESFEGVYRSAERVMFSIAQEEIKARLAEGTILGETREKIVDKVKSVLAQQGLESLIDKGGKKWTLDTYSDMLVRTKAVEARNTGLANRMLENGYDLVEVSDHNSDHEACRRWEGKILSLTGRTKGYPTLDDAKSTGLFHPNCKHAINVIHPELAKQTKAYAPKSA